MSDNTKSAEIIVKSEINDRRVVVVFDPAKDTLKDILAFDDVIEFFDAADADEVIQHLSTINGADVCNMKEMFLRCVPSNGYEIGIDLEAIEGDEDVAPEESTEEGPAEGTEGFVTVSRAGLQEAKIVIQNGKTTINEALFNDVVRARFGMCDTQLSNCDVALNGEFVAETLRSVKTLVNGDTLLVNVKPAQTKGC